jgi:inner membrane protein
MHGVARCDVASFALGIPYGHPLGHRGLTHSLLFAVVFASILAAAYLRVSRAPLRYGVVFAYLAVSLASHGLLDALTTGGRGVGFFIPFSTERYFYPWRPIRVSPIGAAKSATIFSRPARSSSSNASS